MTPRARIERAFARLAERPGYTDRYNQRQLAWLIEERYAEGNSGAYEAPTGLGKSLAALIPALAYAAEGKRTVIATYTNVLAEQYWRKDLPLALELLDDVWGEAKPTVAFLMGRQRYACLAQLDNEPHTLGEAYRDRATWGIESEFRTLRLAAGREATALWRRLAGPPVCPARLCTHYQDCYYYSARRAAERAGVVITNHAVVLQDAVMRDASEGDQVLLGKFDALIVDEAHDFVAAAQAALEFELSDKSLTTILGLTGRMDQTLAPLANQAGALPEWNRIYGAFRVDLETARRDLGMIGEEHTGILEIAPADLAEHPSVKGRRAHTVRPLVERLGDHLALSVKAFLDGAQAIVTRWKDDESLRGTAMREAQECLRNYGMFLREYAYGCRGLIAPSGASVSFVGHDGTAPTARLEPVDLAEPLKNLIWTPNQVTIAMSATLAVDGGFDFFKRTTGAEPRSTEVLASPFDYSRQAALYLPPMGAVPDPSEARKRGMEGPYFDAVAHQIADIVAHMGGRTLALFHSRREMEEVYRRIEPREDLPIYMQRGTGVASVGERFKNEERATLFAVRSFWTGFDAPGKTLSCVVLVRVPFEVPVDPPQLARQAWLESKGENPFFSWTLPQAKMMVRQGAGRLIRRDADHGVIAILDPRVRTKRYGEAILENLPPGMTMCEDFLEAMVHAGLE